MPLTTSTATYVNIFSVTLTLPIVKYAGAVNGM